MPNVFVFGMRPDGIVNKSIMDALAELPFADRIVVSFVQAYSAIRVDNVEFVDKPRLIVLSGKKDYRKQIMEALRALPYSVLSVPVEDVKPHDSADIIPAS